MLATGRASADRLSTRLVLVNYPAVGGAKKTSRLLGLIVERATEVVRLDPAKFEPAGVTAAPWLGGVTPAADGAGAHVQRVNVAGLLTPEVSEALFDALSAGVAREAGA